MPTKSTKQPLTPEEELAQLRARIAELESSEDESSDLDSKKIQQDEYIPVMSLIPFNLNLSTKEGGQGSIKKFTRFGEVKQILYKDLIDILEVHPSFVEGGYFYIMHPAFIRQHGLDEAYSKILTKEKIEEIISTKSEDCVALYTSANPKQQEIIVQFLISKIIENPDSVNLNVVDRISRLSKIDIAKRAEELRPVKEESEE